jgi:hypothetical protein
MNPKPENSENLLAQFKETVDKYSANITSDNLIDISKQFGIDTTRGYSAHQVSQIIYGKIKESLKIDSEKEPEKISRTRLLNLQAELIYRHVLYNEDPVEYIMTLKVINDSCRPDMNYFPPFSDVEKWESAITNCKSYNKFSLTTHKILYDDIRKDYPEDYDIANSVKQLIEKGCTIEIVNSDILITSGMEAVIDELNEKVRTIGGIVLAKSLLNHLTHIGKYSKRFERFFITRETSGVSFDQKPQIPYGFLLNLSLKYPCENLKIIDPQKLLDEIIHLAIIITNGAYGVQPYNFWTFHFQTGDTIIKFCTEIALWDSMFSIPQCRTSTAIEITDKLFSYIDEETFKGTFGFSRQEFIEVLNEIQKMASETNMPVIIYYSTISKKLKQIDKETILKILNFLSHSDGVNENYTLPSDYSSIDFYLKPLLKQGNTKFLLMNKSWCSPNYFESLATRLRESFKKQKKDLDAELGTQLEIFLQNKLTEKGIIFSTGDYKVGGIAGECDLLIESEKAIVLIEFKKKVLTRKSKSGIDTNILLDLSDSILTAQLQAGRTEIILREQGNITLKAKDGTETIVYFNNRQIERVALTQLEFGGFQDRSIINQFLKSLLTHSFGTFSEDTNIIKKFKELAEKQEQWVEQYNKLYELDKGFAHYPFFNCWFLSLPQLLEVINISSDNNTFHEVFRKTKHVTMSTLDWYREFDTVTKLKRKQE